jgi:hypothetical protein
MKFKQVKSGEWQQPVRRGYLLACCDCGLVHRLNFRLAKRANRNWIQFQAFRDGRVSTKGRKLLSAGNEVSMAVEVKEKVRK